MNYGHFDNEKREYVIDRVDLPTSWTNYLGVNNLCAVVNHTAGGYMFYKTPEYQRVTRFRANALPMDRPGHYVYVRDMEDGDYWSVSWQPVGKSLQEAKYTCRHGMSYSTYECEYKGIEAKQTLVIPIDDAVELWDVTVKNTTNKVRKLQIFSYLEFSFHHILMDNQNFQMSLYAAGSSYEGGIIEHDLYYEEFGYQYFTGNFEPDGFDCLRDTFIGRYHTEDNPIAVMEGACFASHELGNNHCGSLQKDISLNPGESIRLIFMLGEGDRKTGCNMRKKYSDYVKVDEVYAKLRNFWANKFSKLQIETPSIAMNTMINTWNLYQAEINVMFSRFASFIEVGGRTGLGYRDTAQDAMTIPHSNPQKCKQRIVELLRGLTTKGYGLHLFQPEWFEPDNKQKPFHSPTVVPMFQAKNMVHGIEDACSDDALWLIPAIVEYIKETGEEVFVNEMITYADGGVGTVYEHMMRILDFSKEQVGAHGVCKGLRADWNDCLNLGGGESAMVSFLHYWAIRNFIELALHLNRTEEVQKYNQMLVDIHKVCEKELWDSNWFIRGITKSGRKIGTSQDTEGKVHLESNAWAVLSGVASKEKGVMAMDSVEKYLYTPYGIMLNAPSYTKTDDEIGFVTRVYPGIKENGSVFSHSNPWAWAAECVIGRGDKAMKYYDALCPFYQNDKIEVREAEPYSYCQFIIGKDHSGFGRARHPFMTGSGGWAYFSATRYMLGIWPQFEELCINPCIPSEWNAFRVTREWRGATYEIEVENPEGVMKGVKEIYLDGERVKRITVQKDKSTHCVRVVMGGAK
ncbi:MAG: GH36-type glycosyl hydrolase domain-containing protein [Velocimicrobium sp.]